MKKILAVILSMLAVCLCLTACKKDDKPKDGQSDVVSNELYEAPEKPSEIRICESGEILSYYDTEEKAKELLGESAMFFNVEENSVKINEGGAINIFSDYEGNIRAIYIRSNEFVTYKGIMIGYDKGAVPEKIPEVADRLVLYKAFFNGDEAVAPDGQIENDYLTYTYVLNKETEKIDGIVISDIAYEKTLR